jgi:hypothetical protein
MKKLILTGCAAILFAIGAIAQVQNDTSSINNNLREGVQETQEDVQQEGNELQRRTEQTGDEVNEDAQDAGNEIREGAERTGNEIEQGAERTGNEIEQGAEEAGKEAEEAGNEIEQGAERTGNEIEQGAERTGEQIEQGADDAKDEMDSSPSSQNNADPNATGGENSMGANTAQPQQHEIEVLEDKEGPNNQVVYKYQGELYYVDREQKQLVQIEESQLKDAEHKAVVSDNGDEQNR